MPLVSSARAGDRLATLRALRNLLAKRIDDPETLDKDVAALSGRLQAVMAEISELEPKKAVGDGIDEIANRRSARRTSRAKSPRNAKRSS